MLSAGEPVVLTRGERNHNPGNLEDFGIKWNGLVGADGPYCVFARDVDGLHALCRDIWVKYSLHHLTTTAAIIAAYAPPKRWIKGADGRSVEVEENDTTAYQQAVAGEMGLHVADEMMLSVPGELQKFATAIIRHENGRVFYPSSDIAVAAASAIFPK